VFERLKEDIQTVFKKDPAARNVVEVLLCYPGLHAIWAHRVAHWLWSNELKLLARLLSHFVRAVTGVEIHPGATVGRRFFIDHGMGVVIGETAEIGDDVLLYQGVVLGGTSRKQKKRHPTLHDGVVIGAGAILLGPIEVGEEARIGAGSVVVGPVDPGSTVVGVPAHDVHKRRQRMATLQHGDLPDPVADALDAMRMEVNRLKNRVSELEENSDTPAISADHEPGGRAPESVRTGRAEGI
jgi:serine O-acetyltransferase